MDKSIKNIIFDWGGVLIEVNMNRFHEACRNAGIVFNSEEVNSTHKLGFFLEYEKGNITTDEMRSEMRRRAGTDISDEEIDRIWNSMIGCIPQEKLELLCSLSEKYNLYLLSNTNEMHWDSASPVVFSYKGMKAEDFFKKIFLSHVMHTAKPETEIFTRVLDEAGLKAEESLFIDDSAINCKAAESVGIRTALYTPGEDLAKIFK